MGATRERLKARRHRGGARSRDATPPRISGFGAKFGVGRWRGACHPGLSLWATPPPSLPPSPFPLSGPAASQRQRPKMLASTRIGTCATRRAPNFCANNKRRARLPNTRAASAIRARWTVDVKFGRRQDAVSLLREWAQNVALKATPPPSNVALLAAAIGVPEARVEMELTFASLAELDSFWRTSPADVQKDWARRFADVVVEGSSSWCIVSELPSVTTNAAGSAGNQIQVSDPETESAIAEMERLGGVLLTAEAESSSSAPPPPPPPVAPSASSTPSTPTLDVDIGYGGENINWNKGDKMPRIL